MSAIYKRDLRAYFTSPVGYVFIAAFLFVMNLVFFLMNMLTGENRLTTCYTVMLYAMMILVPILTMRTFSEDYKQKTDQLLLTSPVRPAGIAVNAGDVHVPLPLGTGLLHPLIDLVCERAKRRVHQIKKLLLVGVEPGALVVKPQRPEKFARLWRKTSKFHILRSLIRYCAILLQINSLRKP